MTSEQNAGLVLTLALITGWRIIVGMRKDWLT